MSNTWRVNYDELKGFVDSHSSIVITPEVCSIPGDVRPEFYRLFDALRENFVKDNFAASLEKAIALRDNHEKIRKELITSLALEQIEVRSTLKDFLSNPLGHVTKLLFDPLFDLLMGKITLAAFEETATAKLQTAFDTLIQQGYQNWFVLALLKTMEPDEVYVVPPLINDFTNELDSTTTESGGLPKQMVPDAVESRRFSFDSTTFVSFLVPKVIVHSKRLNLFASLVPEFRNVPMRLVYLNENVEWLKLSELYRKIGPGKIWPDLAIYLANQPNDLIVVADNLNMVRPDIIVHIESGKDLHETGKPEVLINRNEAFNPKLGSFAVSTDMIPEAEVEVLKGQFRPAVQKPEAAETPTNTTQASETEIKPAEATQQAKPRWNIDIISVGYDLAKLEPVVNAMKKSQYYAGLASNPDALIHDASAKSSTGCDQVEGNCA